MSQASGNSSRLDRIEALTLEIASANLRHDRAIDQNNTAIARHDEEFSRINAILESNAAQLRELALEQRATQQELTHSITDVVGMLTQLATDAAEDRKLIIGLQTENCRILERLEQHMNNGHGEP